MAEYIEQKIERGKKSICDFCFHQKVCKGTGNQPCTKCSHYMDAANVAPVRHGRWERDEWGSYLRRCSVCKKSPVYKDERGNSVAVYVDVCINCGAKMDLEE